MSAKKYYYTNPNDPAAKWLCYGAPYSTVQAAAKRLAKEIRAAVTVDYEAISASGQVGETGTAAICTAEGDVRKTGN